MSLSGTERSLVRTDRGAVSLGVLESSLDFLDFLLRAEGDLETRCVSKGLSVRPRVERPERVRIPSLAVVLRGVGGLWR